MSNATKTEPDHLVTPTFWYPVLLRTLPKVFTFSQRWSLCGQMIQGAMTAVAYLWEGSSMADRTKVMTQTKRDTLVLQVAGWGLRLRMSPP